MGYVGGRLTDLVDDVDITDDAIRAARRVGDRLLELVRRYTPVADPDPRDDRGGRVPGTLRESWEVLEPEVTVRGNVTVTVRTLDPVAPHVEYPTRPHIIRPRRPGGRLRFYADGHLVFAMEVHHPGTKGSFMMTRALAEVSVEWRAIARRELGASATAVAA